MSFELSWHRGKLHVRQAVQQWGGGEALENKYGSPNYQRKHTQALASIQKKETEEKKKETLQSERQADLESHGGSQGLWQGKNSGQEKYIISSKG